MAVKGKKADALPKAPKARKPRAKQEDLPGMEDRKIAELEAAALEYAEGRDERMEMTKREVELQDKLLKLMHKHNKEVYRCGDIEIKIVPKGEKAKVKIHKEKEGSQEEPEEIEI
jgi:hypothetical protein